MRVRCAAVAVLAGVVVAGAGCSGSGVGDSPGIELDRTTSASGTKPIGDVELPAGTLRELWRADVPRVPSPDPARTEFVAGQVVVVSNRGLDVLDANTGEPRWHYYEKARLVADYAVTVSAMVVTTVAADQRGEADLADDQSMRTTGLDALSGRTLWNNDGLQPVTNGQKKGYEPLASAKAGVALFVGRDAKKPGLVAVDARTGKGRWAWATGSVRYCTFQPHDTDGSLLLVAASCGGEESLYALDPSSGAVRWKKSTGGGRWAALTRNGVTLVNRLGKNMMSTLVTANGKEIWKLADEDLVATEFAVAQGRTVLAVSRDASGMGQRLEFVNVRTGMVDKHVNAREHAGLVTAGGHVYGVRKWPGERDGDASPRHMPDALDVIDPAKGKVTTVRLPFTASGHQFNPGLKPTLIHGDRLLRAEQVGDGLRLSLYGPGE